MDPSRSAGTPPYFDVYGLEDDFLPSADPLSDHHASKATTATKPGPSGAQRAKAKAKGGRPLPVPVPAAIDQRPCNFEFRGG
jgi:hypothetical protein